MAAYVPLSVDGVDLLVAAVVLPGSERTSGLAEKVVVGFDAAQAAITAIATRLAGTVHELADRAVHPDKVQVEFGLSFTAKGSILVAESTSGASLKVTITYDRHDPPPAAPGAAPVS